MSTLSEKNINTSSYDTPSGSSVDRVVGEVEQFLQEAIALMEPIRSETTSSGPGRPRILPALCLWAALLVCVLRGFSSQLSLWRLLTAGNFWFYPRFPVSDQAVYKRLAQAGTAPLEQLFYQISSILAHRLAAFRQNHLAAFATEVVALDETTLDSVCRKLPALRQIPKGDTHLLPGKLAGLFDIRRQQWRRIQYIENPHQNEKLVARPMLEGLAKASLILADLGYFGFQWFDELTELDYFWISRLRNKTSYSIIHVYYQDGDIFDGIVWLGVHRADRAGRAVRLVSYRKGKSIYSYITNVLDPKTLPIIEIARLYARRWDFELAVKLIKQHLKLHLLWSAKITVILQQVWAVLIIAQVLHALQLEIAGRAGVDPFDVSLALLVEYMPQFAYTGKDPVEVFVTQGRDLGFIRPSRRTVVEAPIIAEDQIKPLPPDLILVREPRYAHKDCGPRLKKDN